MLNPQAVLEGYFHVRTSLCSLCGFSFIDLDLDLLFFFFFDVRAVFSMDDCHLFPQYMLAGIPLIGDRRFNWCCGDHSLPWILSKAFPLFCGCH